MMAAAGIQTGPGPSAAIGPRRTAWAVIVTWAVVLLAALAAAALTIVVWGDLAAATWPVTCVTVAFATLGALIVRRAGNVFGWIMWAWPGHRCLSRWRRFTRWPGS